MTETQRAAMQQALAKLEQLRETIDCEWGSCRDLGEIDTAGEQWPEVIALRAALAEPKRKRRTVKESLTDDGWKKTREYCS